MKSFQEVFSEAPEDGWCSDVPSVFPEALRLPFVEGVPSEPKVQRMSDWVNRAKTRMAAIDAANQLGATQ